MANLYNGMGETIEISGGGGGLTPVKSREFGLYGNNPTPSSSEENGLINTYKFPIIATWGNEYLNGWYKKLFYGEHVTIAVDGDSTTEEAGAAMDGGRRVDIIKRIMSLGGHTNFTVINNGYGSRASGDYTGYYYSSELYVGREGTIPNRTSHPNGLLADTIEQNPDLIIFGYGLNDFSRFREGESGAKWDSSQNLDLQGRIDLFKTNLEEFLQRLRGEVGTTVNGRECYGRDEYQTAVIICVPISRPGEETKEWSYFSRGMIQKICRQYHCGFFDPTAVNYDHAWSDKWSRRQDTLHPMPYTNADFVSSIQPLLYPMGLWYTEDEVLYPITYNIEHCTLSYEPDHIRAGVKLETTITADDGYTIDSVTMTQDGQTVGVYTPATGAIEIPNIQGDIEITATVIE